MEYLLGFLFGAGISAGLLYINKTVLHDEKPVKVLTTQSRSYAMVAPYMATLLYPLKYLDTQATRHYDSHRVRILYTENLAYWIQDNAVYRARVENNLIVENSEEKLDIMGMDKVELEEMIFIIEKLTEGKTDDRGYPGNTEF